MAEEKTDLVVEALIESNDLLQAELTRLRSGHKVLRTVIRKLRDTLRVYQQLRETAQFNDEVFKALCNGEFEAPVVLTGEGGLPDPESKVESTVANGEEASATTVSS